MTIEIREGYHSFWIDTIMELFNRTELKRSDREKVDRAFQNSFAVASCWRDGELVGIGRMISDGEMYSAIFDVVVDPNCQRSGIGKKVVETLISKTPWAVIHLTSTFGNEEFYLKLGFKKHKTAFALYPASLHPSRYLDYNWSSGESYRS